MYRQNFVRRPVFSLVRLLVRPWPYRVAPAAGKSFGAHICPIPCSLCRLMPSHVHPYPHGPPVKSVSYTHLRAHETRGNLVCRLLLEKKKEWSSSKYRNTSSTNQLHVFALQVGRSVWLNKDYCWNTSSSSKFVRKGGNAWNLFDFDDQSAAIFC